jgi:hypothetical protein
MERYVAQLIVFPPAEKLSESQQIVLSNAIIALFEAHHYMY